MVYRAADRFLTPTEDSQHSTPKPKHLRIVKRFRSVLPALLSSPLFILLPESIRTEVALYFFSTFLYTFADAKLSRKEIKFEADNDTKDANETKRIWQRSRKEILENWRDYLPPAWTVSMMANTFLLWTFIFEPYAFPERYHDAIIKVRPLVFTAFTNSHAHTPMKHSIHHVTSLTHDLSTTSGTSSGPLSTASPRVAARLTASSSASISIQPKSRASRTSSPRSKMRPSNSADGSPVRPS